MSGPLKSDTNRPRKKTKEITRNSNHTCTSLTNIFKKHISPLPYFSSFVLSGAPLVIDTNWKKGILDGHSMDAPSLAILLRDCPLPLKTNPTFHRRKNIFWSIYLLQNFWHPWKSSPWKCLHICNIMHFWSISISNWQVKSWLVPQTEELMSQESKKRKEKFIFAISVQLFQFSFHFIVCNKYPACKDA